MDQSKLYRCLLSLTEQEQKRFVLFIQSPYFNKSLKLVKLYELLQECIAQNTNPDKEKIYKKLSGESSFNELGFNNYTSDLYHLLLQFLSVENSALKEQAGLEALPVLSKKKLKKDFDYLKNRLIKTKEEAPFTNEKDLDTLSHIQQYADEHFIQQGLRVYDDSLEKKIKHLNDYYLLSTLKTHCEALNRQAIIGVKFSFTDKTIALPNPTEVQLPLLNAYLFAYELLQQKQESNYETLLQFLAQHTLNIEPREQQALYQYLQNFCTRQINSGNANYLKKLFELYQVLIEKQLLNEGEYFSHAIFKNITTLALRLKEYDWLNKFIEQQKHNLPPEHSENAFTYNTANYHFSTGNYKEAIRLLQKTEFVDSYYQLGAKTMLLKIYFEQDDADAFFSLTDSFNLYLFRNKDLNPDQILFNKNLVRFAKKIFRIRYNSGLLLNDKTKKQLQALQLLMQKEKVANLQWLMEKSSGLVRS